MEKLLSIAPEIEIIQKNKDGTELVVRVGLCLKYVPSIENWVCKYGTPGSSFSPEKIKQSGGSASQYGIGDSPEKAINDFISKTKK